MDVLLYVGPVGLAVPDENVCQTQGHGAVGARPGPQVDICQLQRSSGIYETVVKSVKSAIDIKI